MSKAPVSNEGVYLIRTLEGFAFASDLDREVGQRWGVGSIVRADIHKPRSGKFNRWYRALVRIVWQHQDFYASPEALHKALKYKLGLFDVMPLHSGEAMIDLRSTGYDAMEEGEFKNHVDLTWGVITKEIIPGLDARAKREMTAEIDKLLLGTLK